MKTIHGSLGALVLLCTAFWFVGCGTDNTHCSLHQNEDGATVMTCPDGSSATLSTSGATPIIDPNETLECHPLNEQTLQCGDVTIDVSEQDLKDSAEACTLHGGYPPYLQCGDTRIPVNTLNPLNDDLAGTCSLQGKDSAGNPILKCGDEQFAIGDGTTVTPVCSGGFVGDIVIDRIDHPILEIFEASNCIVLRGNLIVQDYENTLLPEILQKIKIVFGDIRIQETSLTTISLPTLQRIYGNIYINSNPLLVRVEGFGQLTDVTGMIQFSSNKKLETVSDFNALETLQSIDFSNTQLLALPALPQLEEIANVQVASNPLLESVDSLQHFRKIKGALIIYDNASIPTIPSFQNLVQAGGIYIERNEMLMNVDGFPVLERITGFQFKPWFPSSFYVSYGVDLAIINNNALETLPEFSKLTETSNLMIFGNILLTNAGEYPVLEKIHGWLMFSNNRAITALPEFPSLREVGSLDINGNALLTNAGEYPALEEIHNRLEFNNNPVITALPQFTKLLQIKDFNVHNNEALLDMGSYPALTEILGTLSVKNNITLSALPDFSDLTELNGVDIQGNPQLERIGDFPNIKLMRGSFSVRWNESMIALGNFSQLEKIVGEFTLYHPGALNTLGDFSNLRSIRSGYIDVLNGSSSLFDEVMTLQNQLDDPSVLEFYW